VDARSRRTSDLTVALACLVAFLLVTWYVNSPITAVGNRMFGWEYGFVADSLIGGRGFSDPFGVPSGPTAWMPPIPVALVAAQFLVFGPRTPLALWSALTIKCLGVAASVYLLLRCLDDGRRHRWRYAAALAYVAAIGALPDFFLDLHDIWLVGLVALALVRCFVPLLDGRRDVPRALLLLLSVVAPLTNPALVTPFVMMWAAVLVPAWSRRRAGHGDGSGAGAADPPFRLAAASMALCLGTVLSWTAVSAVRVGLIAPVKSNMWYDFYQANVLDGDGVLRVSTFYRYHPIHSPAVLDRYVRDGERAFMEWHRRASLAFLREHPREFLTRVARRASNAFVFLRPTDDVWEVDVDRLGGVDVACLEAAGVVALDRHQSSPDVPVYLWTNLSDVPDRFRRELARLGPERPDEIFEQWQDARAAVSGLHRGAGAWLRGLGLAGLPALALVLGASNREVRRDSVFRLAALAYPSFLAPYVLISHYARYQLFVLGIQALLVPFGIVAGWRLIRRMAGGAA